MENFVTVDEFDIIETLTTLHKFNRVGRADAETISFIIVVDIEVSIQYGIGIGIGLSNWTQEIKLNLLVCIETLAEETLFILLIYLQQVTTTTYSSSKSNEWNEVKFPHLRLPQNSKRKVCVCVFFRWCFHLRRQMDLLRECFLFRLFSFALFGFHFSSSRHFKLQFESRYCTKSVREKSARER